MSPVTATVVTIEPSVDLQAAIDATPAGGTLTLSPGIWTAPTAAGWVISKPITLQGSGAPYTFENLSGSPAPDTFIGFTTGTVLRAYQSAATSNGGKDSTVLTVKGPVTNVNIYNLGIEVPYVGPVFTGTAGTNTKVAVSQGTGDGIRFDGSAGYIGYCRLDNLSIRFMGRNGIRIIGASLGSSVDQSGFSRVSIAGCRGHGMRVLYGTDLQFSDNCVFIGNEQAGLYFSNSSQCHIDHALFQGNGKSFVNSGQTDAEAGTAVWPFYHQAQLYMQGMTRFSIRGCDFEQWNNDGTHNIDVPTAVGLESCHGGVVAHNAAYNSTYTTPAAGPPLVPDSKYIALLTDCAGITVEGNQVMATTYACYVHEQNGCRGNFIGSFSHGDDGVHLSPCLVSVPNEAEDTTPLPDPNGPTGGNVVFVPVMDASTGNRLRDFLAGIQLPVVSNVTAITTSVNKGTLVYDANANKLRCWDGAAWQNLW